MKNRSKELETNDPNFIVVYDLQSGTLFKKWKAGANTIAVSIACQNSSVVTSLQDARILVWDLVTGFYNRLLFHLLKRHFKLCFQFFIQQETADGVCWVIRRQSIHSI